MSRSPGGLHNATPAELQERLAAGRRGISFMVLRDAQGAQRIVGLEPERAPLTVGRGSGADVCLDWDAEVSRVHAELVLVGGDWAVVDDGLSRNGSLLNGERLVGRRRLGDGDVLRCGKTDLLFRDPAQDDWEATAMPDADAGPPKLTDAQRRALVELCPPL